MKSWTALLGVEGPRSREREVRVDTAHRQPHTPPRHLATAHSSTHHTHRLPHPLLGHRRSSASIFLPYSTMSTADAINPAQITLTATTSGTTDSSPTTTSLTSATPNLRPAEVTWDALDRCADLDHFGPTSPVLRPNSAWYDRGLLIPHSAIRFDMLLMERAVQPQHFQPQRAWKVRRFFTWYNQFFLRPTHHHHDTEESDHAHHIAHSNPLLACPHVPSDEPPARSVFSSSLSCRPVLVYRSIFFPAIMARAPPLPPRMTADHKTMMAQLEAIRLMQAQFTSTTDPKQLDELAVLLRERIHSLAALMREHLNEEEELIPPLMRDHFTEAEIHHIISSKIIPGRGLDNLYLLPSELINQYRIGGEESRAYVLQSVPGPLKWHWRKFSSTWYKPENLDLINSLLIDSDVEPKKPKARGFGVFRWYKQQ